VQGHAQTTLGSLQVFIKEAVFSKVQEQERLGRLGKSR
jgi:hypothetical protein